MRMFLGFGNENDIKFFFGIMLLFFVIFNLGFWNWVMRIWFKRYFNYEICFVGEKFKYICYVK